MVCTRAAVKYARGPAPTTSKTQPRGSDAQNPILTILDFQSAGDLQLSERSSTHKFPSLSIWIFHRSRRPHFHHVCRPPNLQFPSLLISDLPDKKFNDLSFGHNDGDVDGGPPKGSVPTSLLLDRPVSIFGAGPL
jgi:hypothetical protein